MSGESYRLRRSRENPAFPDPREPEHAWLSPRIRSASLAQYGTQGGFTFDFERDAQVWTVGFADLPVGHDQSIYELGHEHGPLPDGLEGSGIYVQGHNRSGDLFIFLKRRVDGLRPNTVYEVSVSVDLATNVSAGMVGIGGSPGESAFVNARTSTVETPAEEDGNQHLRMNIDKGSQARGGESVVVPGNVAHPQVSDGSTGLKPSTTTICPCARPPTARKGSG